MSSFDPRSPGTYSSFSNDKTRSYETDSDTPLASTDSSTSSGLRRVAFSPPPSGSDDSFEGHSHNDSFAERAEVEATLTELDLDAEINATQDVVSQWSSSRPSHAFTPYSSTDSYTGTSTSYLQDTATATGTYFTRDPRVLSTISERTENPSRPTSFAQNRVSAHRLSTHSKSNTRPATETTGNVNRPTTQSQGHTRGVTDLPTTSRRAGDLIAFFEDRAGTPNKERERTTSPFLPPSQSTPHLGSTTGYSSPGYGYTTGFTSTGYGYTTGTGGYTTTGYTTSRPSSPAKSRSSDSRSTVSTASGGGGSDLSLSSLLSPPVRGFSTTTGTFSGASGTATAPATGRTQLSPSDFASTFSSAFGVARGRQEDITPTRHTQTALRRNPATTNNTNTSPRSPLTSVRNIVAAWKERTPALGKVKSESSEGGSELSVPKMEGLFSLRRRASRQGPRGQPPVTPGKNAVNGNDNRGSINGRGNGGNVGNGTRKRVTSTSSLIPPPFDMTDLGSRDNGEPIRIGTLWYLNVHSPAPYSWAKCSALLYPHVLILSWSAPAGGRGVVSLDLINCTEVRSTPGFTHPGARGDIGGVSAAAQATEDGVSLVEVLCPFQLLYSDGVERLSAESARERVRWVSAIWEALDRSSTLPSRSESGSPAGSIRTIRSISSSTSMSASGSGSRSTVFVPPLHTIPSLSDLGSGSSNLSGGLTLSASRVPSVGGHGHTRTTDDTSYLYPSDPRIIAPSRSSSLRRTSSLTDLDEEFASAVSRARSAKPGLGFGLSLVNDASRSDTRGILGVGEGSPVTVSSGPRLGSDVRVTPPPTGKMRNRALSVSEEEFFSAASRTSSMPGSRPHSDFFSADSSGISRSGVGSSGGGQTSTGLVTDETAFEFTSGGSNTQIVPSTLSYRRTESNSYLGDSHDGSRSYTRYTSSDGRSRTPFSSSDSRSRTPYTYSSSGHTNSTPYTYTSGGYTPTSTSPSLSRAEVLRRRYGAYSASEEPSDKENSGTKSTMSGWTRSRTPTTTTEGFLAVEEKESSGSEGYTTAHASPSPSTASFKSLPTIPSESDYQTLQTCKTCVSTEFVTAERCASDMETEYVTAEKCKTETETDYWTAEICKCESDREETQYETASMCRTIPSEEGSSTPKSGLVVELLPADEPIILQDEPIVLQDEPIALQDEPIALHDEPIDLYEEEVVEVDVPPTPPPKTPSEVPSIVSEEPAPDVSITPDAVTAQEEVAPEESLLESVTPTAELSEVPTPTVSFDTDSSVSYSATESDVSPGQTVLDTYVSTLTASSELVISLTPRSEPPLTISMSEDDEDAITPSVHPSQWPSETDLSFDSSALQPTPSVQSAVLQEGGDASFDTSFMRPSVSPLSSVALTPITESISSPAVSPRQMLHPLPSVSSPSSGPTPLTMSTSASSSLSRTPSSVSDVSSIEIEFEEMEEDVVSVRVGSEISTVPSLLSTRSEESMRYLQMPEPSPWNVPLPQSPAPPSVSMSVSMTTPHDDVPSIHSVLETEHTRTHTEQTITHDIDRLLHHIHEIDQIRGQETQAISENIRAIRDELYDLSEYVRTRLVAERPPPVPKKDTSVGGSSVLSTPKKDTSVGGSSVLSTPRGPRPQRLGITVVEVSPPPSHPTSPSSIGSATSYLSSYHSDDDLSLFETELEVEAVDQSYSFSGEPSWPSESSSSSSIPPSDISSSEPSPGPSLSATSSSSPTPPPSSPTPSTESSVTVRQRESITIETLRDMLTSLREQTTALWDGQVSTNHMLDELRQTRVGHLDTTEFNERLQAIEVLLHELIERQVRAEPERPVPVPQPSESISDIGTDSEDLLQDWTTRLLRHRVPLAAPQPRRPHGNLDDELLALLQAPPPQVPTGVQPPPVLIPFTYRPASRPPRSSSPSSPPRPGTFPIRTEPVLFTPEILHRRLDLRRGREHPRPRQPRAANVAETETTFTPPPSHHPQPPVMPVEPPPGAVNFPPRARPATNIPPPQPILFNSGRPPSAPANLEPNDDTREHQSWYSRRRPEVPGVLPPVIPGQEGNRQYVPMPPGPTVVQLPLFDTLMNILREHRLAQLATVDQQRELMRYMRGLNEWLERDVQDRHAELRGVTSRVDELRNDLARLGLWVQPSTQPNMQMPQPQVAQPGVVPHMPHPVIPGGPVPPPPILAPGLPGGFIPQSAPQPPVIPTAYESSPQPGEYTPFIPDEPQWSRQEMPQPYHFPPGPQAHDEYPQQSHPAQYEHRLQDEDEPVIPTSPHSMSSGDSEVRQVVVQPPIIIEQTHTGSSQSGSTSDTQHTFPYPHTHHVYHPPEGIVQIAPSEEGGIPAVVPIHHSGEPRHSHGSPQPHTTIINVPLEQASVYPQGGMADHGPLPVTIQPSHHEGAAQPGAGSGPPFVILPSGTQQPGQVFVQPSRSGSGSGSRSSSSSRGSRPVVVIQGNRQHHSPSGTHVILPSPSHIEYGGSGRTPTHHDFPVDIAPTSGTPVVVVPTQTPHGHRSRSRSRSPSGRRHRSPSPDYYRRHGDDRRRSRSYSPEHRHRRRHYDDYSPEDRHRRRRRHADSNSRSPSPRERHRDDDPRRRRRHYRSDSPSPTPSGARDPGHRRDDDPRRRRHQHADSPTPSHTYSGDPGHRRRPDDDHLSHSRRPSYEEGDQARPVLSHRTPTEFTEGDAPGHHARAPAHIIPVSPRFEDAPRSPSQPTIIRIGHPDQPEHIHPESRGRPVIITPSRTHHTFSPEPRPLSPTTQLQHELRHVRPEEGYIPTVPSEARSYHRSPSVMDNEADPHGRRGGHSRVPSRTGVPAAIREEDDDHPPSEMVHVPPPPVPDGATHVHFDPTASVELEDALQQQHERLNDAERELTQVVHDAHDAENRRETEFRQNEEARENLFLQNEDRREAEARQRGDAIFTQLEERAHSVPPLPVPPPGAGDNASIIDSIHAASHEAASRHASDILDTVRLEREQFDREREALAVEREQERAELAAERARMDEEREQRIRDLEEELAHVRGELDNERQFRLTENEERLAANERDEAMRAQLGDITQLVSEQRDECARKRELMDQRWEEKQGRRAEKDAELRELKDMVIRLVQDHEADRIQEEERRVQEEGKPDIQAVLDQLNQQNREMREALEILSENWRTEGERRHQDTLDAVRATAREQVPFNVQMYLDEFSKALAAEVRMLLGEVGKLREERRNIQHELGYLMMMKAKYGPGGEFDPEWKPPIPTLGEGDGPPPPEAPHPPPEEAMPARPAWRTIPRSTRRIRKPRPDQPPPEPVPAAIRPPVHSWVTWQPNPAMAPTPPSIEPNLIVPDQGSPGLFGPRSPRSSYHR